MFSTWNAEFFKSACSFTNRERNLNKPLFFSLQSKLRYRLFSCFEPTHVICKKKYWLQKSQITFSVCSCQMHFRKLASNQMIFVPYRWKRAGPELYFWTVIFSLKKAKVYYDWITLKVDYVDYATLPHVMKNCRWFKTRFYSRGVTRCNASRP